MRVLERRGGHRHLPPDGSDVVRHVLVQRIIEAYARFEEQPRGKCQKDTLHPASPPMYPAPPTMPTAP